MARAENNFNNYEPALMLGFKIPINDLDPTDAVIGDSPTWNGTEVTWSGFESIDVPISSAEILDLNGNPKLILPGIPGKSLFIHSFQFTMNAGATEYDFIQATVLRKVNAPNPVYSPNVSTAVFNTAALGVGIQIGTVTSNVLTENDGVELFAFGNPTQGNGTAVIRVRYKYI